MRPNVTSAAAPVIQSEGRGVEPQSVLIAILTFKRSARLRRLLPHVAATLKSVHNVEILIVDNNALPSEQKFVENFALNSPYPVHYVNEPQPGVATARNAAVKFAKARFLAFLDDDMEITANWIDGMVKVAVDHKAGLVFGPVLAKFEDSKNPRNPFLFPFHTRQSKTSKAGIIDKAFATGGCLIDLDSCILPEPAFDPRLNESGGEDDIFFESLHDNGAEYGYAPDAVCYECVPAERTTPEYIAKRNFGYGQGPSRIAVTKGLAGLPQLARHMIIGSIQLTIYGAAYLLGRLLKRPSQVRYLALSARGLGKILWFDRFQPKLYGASKPEKTG